MARKNNAKGIHARFPVKTALVKNGKEHNKNNTTLYFIILFYYHHHHKKKSSRYSLSKRENKRRT
jgi:hypothetical protein